MKLSKELKRMLRSTWEIKSEQKAYQAQKTRFSTKKSLYFIYYSLKCSKYIYIYRELFFVVYFVQGTSHRRQLIQSIGNLWAFYLSVSVPYIAIYSNLVWQGFSIECLAMRQHKIKGNLSQHQSNHNRSKKPAHKLSVQSSQVVKTAWGRGKREGR